MQSFEKKSSLSKPGFRGTASVIIICTRNRPEHLARALQHVLAARPNADVLVWDASDDAESAAVCANAAAAQSTAAVEHIKAGRTGLPHQRNDAVRHCSGRRVDVIHFLDDDTEVETGYFDAIEGAFAAEPELAGAGGVFTNALNVRLRLAKRVFLLDGGRPGAVFRSGRPVHGQFSSQPATAGTAWLAGASMSWRLDVLRAHQFNEALSARALAEDLQFSYEVGLVGLLRVVPAARCLHRERGVLDADQRALAKERLRTFNSWVNGNRDNGLSRAAFWWSVVGEVILYGLSGLLPGERRARSRALGVLDGVVELVRSRREQTSICAGEVEGCD